MIKRIYNVSNVTHWDRADAQQIERYYNHNPIYRDGVPVPYTEFLRQATDLFNKHHTKSIANITRAFPNLI